MAKCRINNLTPPCGYNVQGIIAAQVMDLEDFSGFQFFGDGLEDSALVEKIFGGAPVAVPTSSATKYSSAKNGKLYTHTLESFIPELSAQLSASLDLAGHRKFIVIFTTAMGKRFAFGYGNGASLSYTNQSAEALGSLVTLSAVSTFPIFELTAEAVIGTPRAMFDVDFDFGAFCEIK